MSDLTQAQKDDVNHGFSAGNYANAYETTDYETAVARLSMNRPAEYIAAFTLGFFASYELHEMTTDEAEAFTKAYKSPGGRECVAAGYCDPRPELD